MLLADVAKILGEKLIGPVKTALREDLDFLLTRNLFVQSFSQRSPFTDISSYSTLVSSSISRLMER